MNNAAVLPKVALIAGPTAGGKSAAALALARRTGGVIVNADSAQVYADLRVLTARPDAADEARATHRLFGHVDAADRGYSAARWATEARAVVFATIAAGRLPILVGGTGLYIRTLLDGIAPVPPVPADLRAEVRAMPVAAAHAALATEDPQAAARLSPNDTARIARALEVVRASGRPLAHWQARRSGGIGHVVDLDATVLLPDRPTLFAAIDARSAAMIDGGAIDEVEALLARGDVAADAPVRRSIGVDTIAALLSGRINRARAIALLALSTRRYAKRQYTWFRHQLPQARFEQVAT